MWSAAQRAFLFTHSKISLLMHKYFLSLTHTFVFACTCSYDRALATWILLNS